MKLLQLESRNGKSVSTDTSKNGTTAFQVEQQTDFCHSPVLCPGNQTHVSREAPSHDTLPTELPQPRHIKFLLISRRALILSLNLPIDNYCLQLVFIQ